MRIETYRNYIQITSKDRNGIWNIQIQKDCSQIRIGTENDDATVYIDTDKSELRAIRDCLNEVLDERITKP
jgi:hypothetical protein